MNTLFRGTWASVMATSSMTMLMFQAHKILPLYQKSPLPPALLTDDILSKTGLNPLADSETQEELTMFSHYGYGAIGGIAYSALSPKMPMSPLIKGTLFGLAVFGASYYGIIPGLNLSSSGSKMTAKRNLMMLAAHVVWGASLGFAEQELRNKGSSLLDGRKNQSLAR